MNNINNESMFIANLDLAGSLNQDTDGGSEAMWGGDHSFVQRTGTQYTIIPIETYVSRGMLDNRMFDSLCQGLEKGAFIAGGFMTSLMAGDDQANDLDVFFSSAEAMANQAHIMFSTDPDKELWAWNAYNTPENKQIWDDYQALTPQAKSGVRFLKFKHKDGKLPMQFIKIVWYEDATHVIDTFDLTIAQFATDGLNVFANPLSHTDLVRKRIVLHRMQFPSSTLRRIIKYTQKGYYACPGALGKIAREIMLFKGNDEQQSIVYVD